MQHVIPAFEALKPFLFNSKEELDALKIGIYDLDEFRALVPNTSDQDPTVSSSRVVATYPQAIQHEPKGNLRTRVFSLADDMVLYDSQEAYREAIVSHPAYDAVNLELRSREYLGNLYEAMDVLEAMGVVVAYDKSEKLLTLGFCLSKMRSGFQEVVPMRDRANGRVIEWVNGLPEVSLGGTMYRKPRPKLDEDDLSIPATEVVYYITLDLS